MPPRFFVDLPLHAAARLQLPAGTARHVQVLRLQPGAALTLFDGLGGEWAATVTRMGRSDVSVELGEHSGVDRELPLALTIALGMPANERMDALVEKASELGVAAIQPLICERSVLRLSGERAQKKVAHWQAVIVSACEQSGRTRVPPVAAVQTLAQWVAELPPRGADEARWLLSLVDAQPVAGMASAAPRSVLCLSGPEGGLSSAEEAIARAAGFIPVSLGARVLRADTAPLAVLAHLACVSAQVQNQPST